MKFIWIFCNQSIAPEILDLLDSLGVDGYTVWRHVLGHHRGCRTHWGDAVWPGENWAILVVDNADKAWYVVEELKKMKQRRAIHNAGLRAFVQDGELMV
ncbi:hypothetical protein SAMN05444368_1478 [Acetomicrobium flavidum]|uniref:Nitrogen regulatory protein P-II family n=1 Tax=Acetomicrobium flavidum TaxID=49896 RepID=A0ABY1JE84_9BACT|nr:hypothetical protein SAMN05444368_1478 [Acetomicrobium flavidum]